MVREARLPNHSKSQIVAKSTVLQGVTISIELPFENLWRARECFALTPAARHKLYIYIYIYIYIYTFDAGRRCVWRGGGLGSSTIFKKLNEPYAPS